MTSMSSPYPFNPTSWAEIARRFEAMALAHPELRHMSEIVESVIASGLTDRLAATTSMHDLLVVRQPIPEPPADFIAVRAPGSLARPRSGEVIIEHLTPNGPDAELISACIEGGP
jgi:hypothetical protein